MFAKGFAGPFGIAFYPPGPNPKWVYVASPNAVVRFAYATGDLTARGPATTVIPRLAASDGGHTIRDLAFSLDGKRLYISVGSGSNIAEDMSAKTPAEAKAWQAGRPLGAAWGREENRADVLASDPEGRGLRIYATGIRNCAGLAVHPADGAVWCATNDGTTWATTCRPTTRAGCAKAASTAGRGSTLEGARTRG